VRSTIVMLMLLAWLPGALAAPCMVPQYLATGKPSPCTGQLLPEATVVDLLRIRLLAEQLQVDLDKAKADAQGTADAVEVFRAIDARECDEKLRLCHGAVVEVVKLIPAEAPWYVSPWLWFGVGLAAGVGGTIAIVRAL